MERYTHVVVGEPGVCSCRAYLCSSTTSICIKKNRFEKLCCILPSMYFSDFFKELIEYLHSLYLHKYRYSQADVYVYRGSSLCIFLETLERAFIELVTGSRASKNVKRKRVEKLKGIVLEVLSQCRDDPVTCLDLAREEVLKFMEFYRRKRAQGIKALLTRFYERGRAYRKLFLRYFYEFIDGSEISWLYLYDCNEWICWYDVYKASMYLEKLGFDTSRAIRYSHFIDRVRTPILLIRRNRIVVLIPEKIDSLSLSSLHAILHCQEGDRYVDIIVDDVVEHSNAVLFKIVAYSYSEDLDRIAIEYVAVAGFDKYTYTRFIHYVPPTLWNRSVEMCRAWMLGIVDEYGRRTVDFYELIES